MNKCVMRIIEVVCPLIAHVPLYAATYLLLLDEEGGCAEQARNRITIQMHKNKVFGNQVATYLTTATEVAPTLQQRMTEMNLYPIDIRTYLRLPEQFKMDAGDTAFNIRNDLNVFGHFFLWTGYLIIADVTFSIMFLIYWIIVIKPHEMEEVPQAVPKIEDNNVKIEGDNAKVEDDNATAKDSFKVRFETNISHMEQSLQDYTSKHLDNIAATKKNMGESSLQ